MIDSDCGGREEGAAFLCEHHGLNPERLLKTNVVKAGLPACGAIGKCDLQRWELGRGNWSLKAL